MTQGNEQIAVTVVCENALAREGLKRILNDEGFVIRSAHSNCNNALESDAYIGNELIILDSELPESVQSLHAKFPNSHVVLLSDHFDFEDMVAAFKNGADGYILKQIDCASLIGSLHLIVLGEKVMPSELIFHLPKQAMMANGVNSHQAGMADLLSERERDTLRCLVLGYPNKVIAHELDISEATVKVHVKAILRKLMVQNRTQAAIWAVNNGLAPAQLENLDDDSGSLPLGGTVPHRMEVGQVGFGT